MDESCENCIHCVKLYVPPCYEDIPQGACVCEAYGDDDLSVMFLRDNKGMCERWQSASRKKEAKE